jgi:hypothetical protein
MTHVLHKVHLLVYAWWKEFWRELINELPVTERSIREEGSSGYPENSHNKIKIPSALTSTYTNCVSELSG